MMSSRPRQADNLVACYEDCTSALQAMDDGRPIEVWYFGTRVERHLELSGLLPNWATCGVFSRHLDSIADDIETELLNIDRILGVRETDRLSWDVSLLADLSPYVGDLQLNICRFLLLVQRIRKGRRCLVLTDEPTLARALVRAGRDNGLLFSKYGRLTAGGAFWPRVRARLSALKTHMKNVRTLMRARKSHPIPIDRLKQCDVIVIDWAETNSFSTEKETTQSRNLKRVPQYLRDAGYTIGFVANPIAWVHSYADIASNVVCAYDPVILADECRTVWDVLKGIWNSWSLPRKLRETAVIKEIDCFALVEAARDEDQQLPQASLAYAYAGVAQWMMQNEVRPKAIVYPYENQGWERALRTGVRAYLPDTRLVAYQYSSFANRYLSFYPFRSELESERLPDHLICKGHYFFELFAEHGWPHNRLSVGGAMERGTASEDNAIAMPSERGDKTVLCSTSIKLSEAKDLTYKTVQALRELDDVSLIINFHPVVDNEFKQSVRGFLEQHFQDEMSWVRFSEQSSRNLLKKTSVLTFNTSGAAFDALLMGKQVIYVPLDGAVSCNKVPETLSRHADDVNSLTKHVAEAMQIEDAKKGYGSVDHCLGELTPEVFVSAVSGA